MTGKYPARIDLTDFIPGNFPKNKPLLSPENWQKFLPLDEVTIGEKMEAYGYSTGFFVNGTLVRKSFLQNLCRTTLLSKDLRKLL